MRSLKMMIKNVLAHVIYHSFLFRVKLNRVSKENFIGVMYHRVSPKKELKPFVQPGMFVEPDTFDKHLGFFKEHFNMLSLKELWKAGEPASQLSAKKHSCYLTFDDGWTDFYYHAYPLLVKHQIPAVVYLPTGFIGKSKIFWTERLSDILCMVVERCTFPEFKEYVGDHVFFRGKVLSSEPEKCLEVMIGQLKCYREEQIREFINGVENHLGNTSTELRSDFLSWEQIIEMSRSGLVTFGSHTVSHRILTTLSEGEVRTELQLSRQALVENRLAATERISFCYPNGGYDEFISKEVKRSGYACAFTTDSGWNLPGTDIYQLKRVSIHQDISYSIPLLAYRLFRLL